MIIIAGIRKNKDRPTNKSILLRIYADDIILTGIDYWKDLGTLFQTLADRFSQKELDEILEKHKLANKVIEVLPDETQR